MLGFGVGRNEDDGRMAIVRMGVGGRRFERVESFQNAAEDLCGVVSRRLLVAHVIWHGLRA